MFNLLEKLNQTLFMMMNLSQTAPLWWIKVLAVIADKLIFLIPILLIGLWFVGNNRTKETLIKATLVTAIALTLNQIIALFYQHPRPDAMGMGHTFIAHALDASFPSDHATVFASIGLTLCLDRLTKSGFAVLLIGVLVSYARVSLGVHFPLDILAAFFVSFISYILSTFFWNQLGNTITSPLIDLYIKIEVYFRSYCNK